MQIIINAFSQLPIYEQISAQIECEILSGQLKSGESLPSIRVLANDLKVSVITTKKAYETLERKGLILMLPQRGTVVAQLESKSLKDTVKNEIKSRLLDTKSYAEKFGISLEEIKNILEEIKEIKQ